MKDKIEIINFSQDRNFTDRYHQETPEIELHFKTFKLSTTRKEYISKQGAETFIEYYNSKWIPITALFQVKGKRDIYYGDIKGETAGIWVSQQKESICIAIFKGHRPKSKSSREKKVINYINSQKRP